MPEGFIQLPPNSTGLKAHTFQRSIGANTVEDEVVLQGEQYLATYRIVTGGTSIATLDSHSLQIMAGATLKVYVRRIRVYHWANVTTALNAAFDIVRLTTAGTGGTAQTENPLDTTDAASGAQGMTLPTVKGTEGALLDRQAANFTQTTAASPGFGSTLLYDFNWESPRQKSLIIPAGVTNGIAVKNIQAAAGGSIVLVAEYVEANF